MSVTPNSQSARVLCTSLKKWSNVVRLSAKEGSRPLSADELSALAQTLELSSTLLTKVVEACDAGS